MNWHIRLATLLVNLLYNQFSIANYRIGFYPILAIVPGIGDVISFFLSVYMLWIARTMNIPFVKRMQMIGNILFDLSVGSLPVVGDLVDTFFRAHVRNLEILKQYAANRVIEGEIIENGK